MQDERPLAGRELRGIDQRLRGDGRHDGDRHHECDRQHGETRPLGRPHPLPVAGDPSRVRSAGRDGGPGTLSGADDRHRHGGAGRHGCADAVGQAGALAPLEVRGDRRLAEDGDWSGGGVRHEGALALLLCNDELSPDSRCESFGHMWPFRGSP